MGCCKTKKNSSAKTSCITVLCRIVLLFILIINTFWGFAETSTAIVINYLVNHPSGPNGFTNSEFEIRDITYIERNAHDKKDPSNLPTDVFNERHHVAKLRKSIVENCTTFDVVKKGFKNQACNTANEEERQFDYYCAIVEHPEKYNQAFQPLVFNWLVYNCFLMMTIPIKLVSTCWTSQTIRLLGLYMFLQLIPIGIALSIIISLFPMKANSNEENIHALCALDYLNEGFPVRYIYGTILACRFGIKVIEGLCILLYIYRHKAEKRRVALGLPTRPILKSGKVGPDPTESQASESAVDFDTAFAILKSQNEAVEENAGLNATLSMNAILPPTVSPSPSQLSLRNNPAKLTTINETKRQKS